MEKPLDESMYVALAGETSGMYSLVRVVVPVGGGPPPHTHIREDEGFYVEDGKFRFWVGIATKDCRKGEHAFGPRGRKHCFRNIGEGPGILLLIFVPGGFERYFMALVEARTKGGVDLLLQEEAIDQEYGVLINRREKQNQ